MIMCLLCRIDSVNCWLEIALSLPYLGENCEQVGISAQGIVNHILPVLPISSITKGVVFELNAF